MGNVVPQNEYLPNNRQKPQTGKLPKGKNAGYPGGRADYPGKFEKPRVGKPHKRF